MVLNCLSSAVQSTQFAEKKLLSCANLWLRREHVCVNLNINISFLGIDVVDCSQARKYTAPSQTLIIYQMRGRDPYLTAPSRLLTSA